MAGASSETTIPDPLRAAVLGANGCGPVVVTGADGFIGRALVAHFEASGRRCRAIVRRRAGAPGHVQRCVVPDLATVSDAALDAAVADASAIVHLAGRAHVLEELTADPAAEFSAANVVVTERLAHAAVLARVPRFVFASSAKVGGEVSAPGRPLCPADAPDPRDAYAQSKLDAERVLETIAGGTATAPIVLRLPLVYGPGVKGNFGALLDEVARARRLPLGAIRNRRSLLYVGNLVEAVDAALDAPVAPAGIHYVADAPSVAVPDLVTAVGVALGIPARIFAIPVWALELGGRVLGRRREVERLVGSLEVDAGSFAAATGWTPRHTLAEGLLATAAWWRLRHAI